MPQIIEHIDALARQKGRDVLFVHFGASIHDPRAPQYEELDMRRTVIAWLDAHGMAWQPCGPVADPDAMGSYDGQVYLDVPYDENNEAYQALRDFLEMPDGTPAHERATFCYYPLALAMKNAHHDAPGFWENWAENL